jgi:hypothetical protein
MLPVDLWIRNTRNNDMFCIGFYIEAADTEKTPWWFEPLDWDEFQGIQVPSPGAATWANEGTPWLIIEVEDIAYNVDVTTCIRAVGL